MKNRILLFAALIASAFAVAQEKPSFGVRGGFTSTGMKGEAVNNLQNLLDFTDGMVTTSNRSGFFAGGYASIPVSEIISIEPALYYTQKGYEMRGDLNLKGVEFLGANARARLNSQYIDMPVLTLHKRTFAHQQACLDLTCLTAPWTPLHNLTVGM
jgi:hypothetical protein